MSRSGGTFLDPNVRYADLRLYLKMGSGAYQYGERFPMRWTSGGDIVLATCS
jgi:hypothetical protein